MMVKKSHSKIEVENGLTHEDAPVRFQWAQNNGFAPTVAQIERGLAADDHPAIRRQWTRRLDFKPTARQIARGLTDTDWNLRWGWAGRMDFTPTPGQVERGLTDLEPWVREEWIKRPDLVLSLEALNRVVAFLEVNQCQPLPEELAMRLRAQAEVSWLEKSVKTTEKGSLKSACPAL